MIRVEKEKYKQLQMENIKLQNERLEEEKKANDDEGLKLVLSKLDQTFVAFKEKYNESKLQIVMNETPQKLMDKQSDLNKELFTYKQCIDGLMISTKAFAKYVQDIDGIIDTLSTPDLSSYKQWNIDTIIIWIRGLENGRYNKYLDLLRHGFEESEIDGDVLPDVTRSDLTNKPFNIKNFKDKRDLENHFKSLRSPQNMNMNDEPAAADEGAPTAFI